MKAFVRTLLVICAVLAVSAFASPAYAQDTRDPADKWEIGVYTGWSWNSSFGRDETECIPAITDGCSLDPQVITHRGNGIYPTTMGNLLAGYQTIGGVRPRDGWIWGIRVGYDVNPRWQLEFSYDYGTSRQQFTNQDLALGAFIQWCATFGVGCGPTANAFGGPREFAFFDPGKAQGLTQTYLFGVNYHLSEDTKWVPYLGAGLGWERWYNGPNAFFLITAGGGCCTDVAGASKTSDTSTAFAIYGAAGFKYHINRHWGLRFEARDIISFPRFDHQALAVDLNGGFSGTPGSLAPGGTATIRQRDTFNQLQWTAGLFYRWGGGSGSTRSASAPYSPDPERDRNTEDRWEIGLFTGWSWGRTFGSADDTSCSPGVTNGCSVDPEVITHDGGGIYPTFVGVPLALFQTGGGVEPREGWLYGVRAGYDLNPRWQLEFSYDYNNTNVEFSNLDQAIVGLIQWCTIFGQGCFTGRQPVVINPGNNSGDVQTFLFNVNYHLREEHRWVPYIGAGLGWQFWYNGPIAAVALEQQPNQGPFITFHAKQADDSNAFALNAVAGLKYHINRSWGLRFEVRDIISFVSFDHPFVSIDDVSGNFTGTPSGLAAPTGTVRQSSTFNMLQWTGGLFFRW
jgi:outer membrane protein W